MASLLFYLVGLIVLAADQASKWWIRGHVDMGQESVVWGFVHVTRLVNTGATGDTFQGQGRWLVPVAVLIIVVVMYYRRKGKLKDAWMAIGTGLFAGGAIGNAIDRVAFGGVTDFLQLKERDAVMNIADLSLTVGMLVLIVAMILSWRRKPSVSPAE